MLKDRRGPMPADSILHSKKMTVREKLTAAGVANDEVLPSIFRNVYPLPARIWWWLRVRFSFDPFTAEREFLNDLGDARNITDIDVAAQDYRYQSPERKAWFMKPSRRRAKDYFRQVFGTSPYALKR